MDVPFHHLTVFLAAVPAPEIWAQHAINQAEWFCARGMEIVTITIGTITFAFGVVAPYLLQKRSKRELSQLVVKAKKEMEEGSKRELENARRELRQEIENVRSQLKLYAKGLAAKEAAQRLIDQAESQMAEWLNSTSLGGMGKFLADPSTPDVGSMIAVTQIRANYYRAGRDFIDAFGHFAMANETEVAKEVLDQIEKSLRSLRSLQEQLTGQIAERERLTKENPSLNVTASASDTNERARQEIKIAQLCIDQLREKFGNACWELQRKLEPEAWNRYAPLIERVKTSFTAPPENA